MTTFGILITIIVLVFVIYLIKYMFFNTSNSLVGGIRNGRDSSVIDAKSLAKNGANSPNSNFAYSCWFYVNDWTYRYGAPKVLFGRMGGASGAKGASVPGLDGVNPGPAIVFDSIKNNLNVYLTCTGGPVDSPNILHTCTVANIPIQRWVQVAISVYGRSLDVYINGKLVKTCVMPGIATVANDAGVYLTPSGGFDGWTSRLAYFPNSLNPQDVWKIYSAGATSGMSSLSSYQVQLSLVENGQPKNSVTF